MDDRDRELLHLLTIDARMSATELGKKLHISRGTVQNRINRLVQKKVIHRFTVELGAAEGDNQVSAFTLIKLKADDSHRVLAALRKILAIVDIHSLSGKSDYVVEIRASSLQRLDAVLDEIRKIPDVAETQSHLRLSCVT